MLSHNNSNVTNNNNNNNKMVSRRNALLFVAAVLLQGDSVSAFTTSPLATPQLVSSRVGAATPLYATTTAATRKKATTYAARLTRDEEKELLRQTTEMRRIQALEKDLALQSPTLTPPLLSIRADAAGYGTDLESYETALDAGHEAREVLVTRNMGLVHYAVKEALKTRSRAVVLGSLSKEDLIQEGAIGLARAVDKYNIGIGGKFSSYAIYWIRASVLRCIAEKSEVVRVPEHVSTAVRKMTAAANRMNGENNTAGASPLWQEAQAAKALAEEAGLTPGQLKEAIRVKSRRTAGSISFEDWMQKGQDLHSDVVTNSDDESVGAEVDATKLRFQLNKFLRPKEMKALSLRYGLEEEEEAPNNNYQAQAEALVFEQTQEPKRKKSGEMTFADVGKQMSVSAEYGRRLVHTALAKLQKAAQAGELEPALLF